MWKIMRRMSVGSALLAVLFMCGQVMADLYLPTLTSNIISDGVAKGDIDYIWKVGIVMIGVSFLGILASLGNRFFATREGMGIGKKLRSQLYHKSLHFSNDNFEKFGTASLITRTTNDVNQVQLVAQLLLRVMINAPLMLVGASFLAYRKDPALTKVFVFVIPIMLVVVGTVMYFAIPLFKSMQTKVDKLNRIFREGLTGVRVIRAFNRSDYEADRFREANKDYTQTAVKVFTIMSFLLPVVTLIMSGTNVAIVWYGSHYIADMQMEIGNLIAFMTYAMQILMSFMMLSMIVVLWPRAQASAERINQVLDTEDDLLDPETITDFNQDTSELTFEDVSFTYEGAEAPALSQISFQVNEGETLAIIGGTGSGKTTLVNLIPRFFDINQGEISVNQTNISEVNKYELRQRLGLVPQKAILFKGTIRSNMQFGDAKITDERIWEVLDIAQAKEFVSELDDGLDSIVEQGGTNFSGGQRQRLCIARALCKTADIYIFDDSFSALDFKTDANLRKALTENVTDAVKVIVAQRISTVIDADQILVLDQGKMVGLGTHSYLNSTCETYQEIVKSQIREEDAL